MRGRSSVGRQYTYVLMSYTPLRNRDALHKIAQYKSNIGIDIDIDIAMLGNTTLGNYDGH